MFSDKFIEQAKKLKVFSNFYKFYLNKLFYPITKRWYVRSERLEDLKEFCKKQLEYNPIPTISEGMGYDNIANDVLLYVKGTLQYKTDLDLWEVPEYWQDVSQTLGSDKGDCEDGAILILTMCRRAGIPANRILLTCGDTLFGGHAWITYITDKGKEKKLEWTAGNWIERYYEKEWFRVNDQFCIKRRG